MNIVQIHDRVRFWIDSVASARFESSDIDQAINNAVREIVDEKYDHSRLNHRGDSFQRTQRIRDELINLVKPIDTDGSLTLTKLADHVLVTTPPDDYKYLLAIALYVGTTMYPCWPLSYDRLTVINRNPFRRVKSTPQAKLYYIEETNGVKIYHPFAEAAPTKVKLYYLADPVDAFYGYEKGPADSIGLNTDFICSLSPTDYDGTEYVSGTELTTDGVTAVITYGLAVTDFVNPSINGLLHEEIARRAAMNCLLSAGNFDKYKMLKAEVLAT